MDFYIVETENDYEEPYFISFAGFMELPKLTKAAAEISKEF